MATYFNFKCITVHKSKGSILQVAIDANQFPNKFIFSFPIQWNQNSEKYVVSQKLLNVYWFIPVIKLLAGFILIYVGLCSLTTLSSQNVVPSGPILFMNIAFLLSTTFSDTVFIFTAYDIVCSFNCSYRMEQYNLANTKIGKISIFILQIIISWYNKCGM